VLGGTGRTLITAGTLILLFVAYQLWGTGLQADASQKTLDKQFSEVRQEDASRARARNATSATTAPPVTAPDTPTTTAASNRVGVEATPVAAPELALPKVGDPIALIKIPKIGVTRTVVEGVSVGELKRGPGHYPETPLPGQAGNAAIAGHRTTYGQPFHNVDKLGNGDQIIITTRQGEFVYEIDRITVVKPSESSVLLPTKDAAGNLENRITLTACHPKYSAKQRIIISGLLVGRPIAALPGQAKAREKAAETRASDPTATTEATLDATVSGRAQSKSPAITWGLAGAAIWFAAWLVQVGLRRLVRRRAGAKEAAGASALDAGAMARPSGRGGRRGRPRRPLSGPWRTGPYPSRGQRLLTWSPYVLGVPVFLVTLYFFFENFALLLPANF
jgi:sortase A